MRFPILAAIAALSVSTTAHAEQWWITDLNEKRGIVVELDSISTSPTGTRRMWVAVLHATPIGPKNDTRIGRSFLELDCTESRVRFLQSDFMTEDFDVRDDGSRPDMSWSFAAPGTIMSRFLDVACRERDTSNMAGPWANLGGAVKFYFRYLSNPAVSK